MHIRNEKTEDRSVIATLIARTYMKDGARTIEITGLLRDLPNYSTNNAFIAEDDGEISAYALFTPIKIGNKGEALLLAPLAVDTLVNFDVDAFLTDIFAKLKKQGHDYILMHGSVGQYTDMGFVSASEIGLDDGLNVEGVDLLMKNISGKAVTETGKVDLPDCLHKS